MDGQKVVPSIKDELMTKRKFLLKSLQESYLELTAQVLFINMPVDKDTQLQKQDSFFTIGESENMEVEFNKQNTLFNDLFERRLTTQDIARI